MAREETWRIDYDADHVGFMVVPIRDDETVEVAYEVLARLLERAGLTKVVPDGS